jgi:hypothetical protein
MLVNRPRALDLMREAGLDALVASSVANVTYLSGYSVWLAPLFREYMVVPGASSRRVQENFAVLPAEGDPALVIEPFFAVNAVTVPGEQLVLAGGGDYAEPEHPQPLPGRLTEVDAALARPWAQGPVDGLVRALEERGLGDARLGVELDGMPPDTI